MSINLTGLRKAKGLTQKELSAIAGIDRISLSRYESQKIVPGGKNLMKLAKALECRVDELISEDEESADACGTN